MKCMVLNFNGTTHRDDALVGHDTVIVIKDKKVVKLLFYRVGGMHYPRRRAESCYKEFPVKRNVIVGNL